MARKDLEDLLKREAEVLLYVESSQISRNLEEIPPEKLHDFINDILSDAEKRLITVIENAVINHKIQLIMEINEGAIVIINGDNLNDGAMKIVHQGVQEKNIKQDKGPLTYEELARKVTLVKERIDMSKRLYFPICRYMMWRKMVPEGDFRKADEILEQLFPGLDLDVKDLSKSYVYSFRKQLDEWVSNDAPVHGATFNKYYAVAELMYVL